MTRDEVRAIVIELLKELVADTLFYRAVVDEDGEEHNSNVFDGEEFVSRILSR